MTKGEIWKNFNHMQNCCMAKDSIITKEEFFSEPEEEQKKYYNWMCRQVSEFNAGPYWR